jgi:hypothetical protein
MDNKARARAALIGLMLAAGAATAANAVTVVINPPSKRTRADACSFLSSVIRSPDPFRDNKSPDSKKAQAEAKSLANRAHKDVCVEHAKLADPPIFPDGSQHFGAFKNGQPDGLGVRFYADGSRYIGEWKNGQREGQGLGIQPDGARYVGHWAADKPQRPGIVQYHAKIGMTVAPK